MKNLPSLICLVTYLTCTLAMSPREWPIGLDMACNKALSAVACTFEFTNMATEDYYILTSDSPLEGLYSPFVALYHDGRHVQYEGLIGYRLPPRKQDFQLIKAGQVISATVQISDAFTFASDGLYIMKYNKPLKFITKKEMDVQVEANNIKQVKVSKSLAITLEGTHLLNRPAKPMSSKPDYTVYIESCTSANYVGGSASQRKDTTDAHKLLCNKIQKARDDISDNELYRTWFGAYTAARADDVIAVYVNTKNGLTNNAVTYDFTNGLPLCKKKNWMAYTSYGTTTTYLCGPYGYDGATKLCSTATISKEDTLLHEWTHAFAGTVDHTYGTDNCEELARTDPDEAIENADNYSFHYCRVPA